MYRIMMIAALVAVSGCASITTGQNQSVSVDAPDCGAMSCRLTNKDGTYFVNSTPGTVMVNRSCGDLTLQCSKEGEPDYIMTISSSVKAMAFGNVLFGGLIGVGVDAYTGAACEYPSMIPVPKSCGTQVAKGSDLEFEIPGLVSESAEELGCNEPTFVARGPAGVDVYSTQCEDADVFMNCTAEECKVSEYETQSGN